MREFKPPVARRAHPSARLTAAVALTATAFGLLLTVGCASRSEKLTEQAVSRAQAGQLNAAAHNLVEALAEDPEMTRADSLLREVLPDAYEEHRDEIQGHEEAERWDQAVAEYDEMIELSEEVADLPADYPTVDADDERRRAAEEAAEDHFAEGKRYFEAEDYGRAADEFLAAHEFISDFENSRTWAARAFYNRAEGLYQDERYREAAETFERATSTEPGFEDAAARYEEARQKALISVVVVPFEDQTGRNLGSLVADESMSKVMNRNLEFMEFVAPTQVAEALDLSLVSRDSAVRAGQSVGVDAFVFGNVLSVRLDETGEQVEGPYESSVESDGEVYRARYRIHSRSASARVRVSYQIVDVPSGRVAAAETLRERETDTARWLTYEGDRGAIPPSACPDCTGDQYPDDAEVLLDRATARLTSRLATQLYGHFE